MKIKSLLKYKPYLIILYILTLIFGYFYVSNVLTTTQIKEYKEEKKEVDEVKPAVVYLNFNNEKTFRLRLQNTESVADFLDKLRDDDLLFFERTLYTYGTELVNVDNRKIDEGYKWKVFLDGSDITYSIHDINLKDDFVYDLLLVKE